MDLNAALKWLSAAVANNIGHSLREPEIVILKGTWRGLTYEQMAGSSDYSTNYLMRDVAPKLWKQLSNVFGRSVGKTNFRVALEAYAAANAGSMPELADIGFSSADEIDVFGQSLGSSRRELGAAESGLYWHSSVLPEASIPINNGNAAAENNTLSAPLSGRRSAGIMYGGALSSTVMYGYEVELSQAKQWVSEALTAVRLQSGERERQVAEPTGQLVGIWGLRGIGKTLLVEKLVAQMGDRFEGISWQSLQVRPSLEALCTNILRGLGVQAVQFASAQLLSLMSQKSLLIVLEDVEALLQSGTLAGDYQQPFRPYIDFFQSVMGTRSCLIITGIEGPAELVRQGGYGQRQSVRSLTLTQLSEAAAIELLQAEAVAEAGIEPPPAPSPTPSPERSTNTGGPSRNWPNHWPELVARYQGHPLALKAASRVIREIFNGQLDAFLAQSSVLFTDILRLLSPSFQRLSLPETNILYWLASQDAPLSLAELQQTLPLPLGSADLISALDSLKQRSLLRIDTRSESPTFYLPALVKAYAVHQFMERFAEGTTDEAAATTAGDTSRRSLAQPSRYNASTQIIDLSPPAAKPVQLSQWFQGQFDADWQSLTRLFEASARPAMRLRNAYHLQDETFIKRCKSIDLSVELSSSRTPSSPASSSPASSSPASSSPASSPSPNSSAKPSTRAVLLVAIHQDAENAYKVCVQAQPAKDASVLPEGIVLKLLDTQQSVLATVEALEGDTFIQLPYFRGASSEPFSIELAIGERHHTETFII